MQRQAVAPTQKVLLLRRIGSDRLFSASGNGTGRSWNNRGTNGNYWSSTWNSARNARNLNFNSGGVNPQNNNNRYYGMPVRPVQHLSLILQNNGTAR